ncbi:hypothetical protein V6N13_054526 [Hibiscus sabdariffa]|uniref:Small acidic protein 1 n=1 Tax=Hibiscus sabdariffa TaxID=183260 RepID=A0ABR2DXJ1_9ROSI
MKRLLYKHTQKNDREENRSRKKKSLEAKKGAEKMRPMPMPMEYVTDPDDQGSAMEVDDVDSFDLLGEGVIGTDNKLADADFFNNFEDDFDDSDIN